MTSRTKSSNFFKLQRAKLKLWSLAAGTSLEDGFPKIKGKINMEEFYPTSVNTGLFIQPISTKSQSQPLKVKMIISLFSMINFFFQKQLLTLVVDKEAVFSTDSI